MARWSSKDQDLSSSASNCLFSSPKKETQFSNGAADTFHTALITRTHTTETTEANDTTETINATDAADSKTDDQHQSRQLPEPPVRRSLLSSKPQSPLPRRSQCPTKESAPPSARFLEDPDFPANRPLGFPHLLDTWCFSADTDLGSFRLVDAVATVLFKYNRQLCERFFDRKSTDIEFAVTDLRLHSALFPTWLICRKDDMIKVSLPIISPLSLALAVFSVIQGEGRRTK